MAGAVERRWLMWAIAGAIVVSVFVTLALATGLADVTGSVPKDMKGLSELHSDQCERPRANAAVMEPQNTWSNLAYLLAGVLVLLRARTLAGRFFGGALCVLAICSGAYHAMLQEGPQILDVAMVYAALFAAILVGVHTIAHAGRWHVPWWVMTLAFVALVALSYAIKKAPLLDSEIAFGILVGTLLVGVVVAWLVTRPAEVAGRAGGVVIGLELLGLLGIAALGMVVQLNDGYSKKDGNPVEDALCSPDAFIQPHAVWHVLSAAALLLTYDIFAQLQRVKDTEPDLPVVLP